MSINYSKWGSSKETQDVQKPKQMLKENRIPPASGAKKQYKILSVSSMVITPCKDAVRELIKIL